MCNTHHVALDVQRAWFAIPPRGRDGEDEAKDFLLELCPWIDGKAAELAKACGYLPLALRIAGSFLQVNDNWVVENYLNQLGDRKKRLTTLKESREGAELITEPDLLATFELSYNQLSEENQKRWRMLRVFPASFASNAAQTIWELEGTETATLLDVFRRYSLLEFDEKSRRHDLHDLLKDYALEQLEKSGEEQTASLKHATHYLYVLSKIGDLYNNGGDDVLTAMQWFDLEWEHIRTGHFWVTENMKGSSDITALVALYPSMSSECLFLRLALPQYIKWLELALFASKQIKNKSLEASHLGNMGRAYSAMGETRKAVELYEQASAIHHEVGDRHHEGVSIHNLGNACKNLNDSKKAIEYLNNALLIYREFGARRSEGAILCDIGAVYVDLLGDLQKGIDYFEKSLLIFREGGHRYFEGIALGNLGVAYEKLGDTTKSIDFYGQRLVIAREIRDRRGEGQTLGNLGGVYFALDEARRAITFYEQQLDIMRDTGDLAGEGMALGNLGNVFFSLGDKEKGIELTKQALEIFKAIESPYSDLARKRLKEWRVNE